MRCTAPAALTAARHFLARGSPWNMPSSGLTSVRTCTVAWPWSACFVRQVGGKRCGAAVWLQNVQHTRPVWHCHQLSAGSTMTPRRTGPGSRWATCARRPPPSSAQSCGLPMPHTRTSPGRGRQQGQARCCACQHSQVERCCKATACYTRVTGSPSPQPAGHALAHLAPAGGWVGRRSKHGSVCISQHVPGHVVRRPPHHHSPDALPPADSSRRASWNAYLRCCCRCHALAAGLCCCQGRRGLSAALPLAAVCCLCCL